MIDVLAASQVLLWLVVLCLVILVLALTRQVGILHERSAPMGALITDSGPQAGHPSPVVNALNLAGGTLSIGSPQEVATLLFFVSPTCPVCKKLLPVVRSIQRAERAWLRLVLASDGEMPEHQAFRQKAGLLDLPYLLSHELGMSFRVSKLPYAVLIDPAGVVLAKGLVNSREQVESLFTAGELGVASLQQFVSRPQTT